MMTVLLKILLFIVVFSAIVSCLLIFDGYLKSLYARLYPEAGRRLMLSLKKQSENNWLTFSYFPDYQRTTFDPILSVSWVHLTVLQLLLSVLIMMISMWKLSDAIQTKKRIVYVEVLNKGEKIDRQTSK